MSEFFGFDGIQNEWIDFEWIIIWWLIQMIFD